jgi:hypothetical protein
MAHVSAEVIEKARTALKALNKQYGVKATLSGKNTLSMKLKITEGSIDFIGNYCDTIAQNCTMINVQGHQEYAKKNGELQVNHFYLDRAFSGVALEYLEKAKEIMLVDHWDDSDVMTDYFSCAYYIDMHIGSYSKPYVLK